MKFSVVTISFNQAEFLERTIRSVISQDGIDLEYIMVDPGSTDGSRDIIERYRPHFAHVVLDKDEGAADGLNKGFALATGEIYAYLNSDDTFEPEAFRTVARAFDERPATDVLCGHAWITDGADTRLRRAWSEPFERLFVAHGMAIQIQPSTFIRRAAFLKVGGFNKANRRSWDSELLLDLHRSGARIDVIDAFLSTYRLHRHSITNSAAMEDQSRAWSERRFEILMGHKPGRADGAIRQILRVVKHARHPQAFLERVARGRIHGRGIS